MSRPPYLLAVPAALHCPAHRVISDARATLEFIARNIQSAMTAVRMEYLHVRITARRVVMVIIAMSIPAMIALRGDILHVRLTAIYAKLIRFTALFMAMAAAPAVIAPAPEATNFL